MFVIELTYKAPLADPFHARGLADVRVVEFRASQRADDIQKLIDR